MADEGVQMELARLAIPEEFVACALAIAARGGIALAAEDLAAALRPDPLGIMRLSAAPAGAPAWPPRHWLPVQVAGPTIDWAHFAGAPLAGPFFADSVRRAVAMPFNRLFRYSNALGDFIANADFEGSLLPDGFVFHMSRCGSTLVSRMLAAIEGSIAVSEAAPLDAIAQLAAGASAMADEHRIAALRAMIAALGRRRSAGERRYFVKLDSWHVMAMPLFRQAFPAVPWIFVYRDPVEVMASQMRMRGMQTVQGMIPASIYGLEEDFDAPAELWCARVLGRICETAAERFAQGGGLLVNHADLPGAAWPAIADHFGIARGEAMRESVMAVGRRDAKAPATAYADDRDGKRSEATDAVRTAVARHLAEPYRRLEALRRPL